MRTRAVDLELEGGAIAPVSMRYGAVRMVVRRRGLPVGVLQVGTAPAELAPAALRERAVEAAEWALSQDLLAHELTRGEAPPIPPSISVVV